MVEENSISSEKNFQKKLSPIEWRLRELLLEVTTDLQLQFAKKAVYLLQVSGGRDSMCLLHAFLKIKAAGSLKAKIRSAENSKAQLKLFDLSNAIQVVHFNHGKRFECQKEEEYLRDLCLLNGVPITVFTANSQTFKSFSSNFQEASSLWRKKCLKEEQNKMSEDSESHFVAVTAHHARDVAENFLLRLSRGTGLSGWSGFQKKKSSSSKSSQLKPFLEENYAAIVEYQEKENVRFFEDSSNQTDAFSRNYIRHHILPHFLKLNPNFENSMRQLAQEISQIGLGVKLGEEQSLSEEIESQILNTESMLLIPLFSKKNSAEISSLIRDFFHAERKRDAAFSFSRHTVENLHLEMNLSCQNPRSSRIVQVSGKRVILVHYNEFLDKICGTLQKCEV